MKSKGKHDSKKRKRGVVNEGVSDAAGMKKRKRKKERMGEKEDKENDKNMSGKVKVKECCTSSIYKRRAGKESKGDTPIHGHPRFRVVRDRASLQQQE